MLKYLNIDRKHYLVLRLTEVLKKLDSMTMVVNVWFYRDYIVEHDIDLFAITEMWLTDDSLDEFYCRDICPEGYNIEQLPRNYAHGSGVALVYRRCFKVRRDVQTIHRSFELINIHITSVYNHNLRLVVIYRAPPSLGNGFTVRMFLEEFSSFLEGLVSTTNALLVAGDFNFHIDEPNDCEVNL